MRKQKIFTLLLGLFLLSAGQVMAQLSTAKIQVIHNSPSDTVDVYVAGNLALDNVPFRAASEFLTVPAGVSLDVGVALSNSSSVADTFANFTANLTANETYYAMAVGIPGNATTPFNLVVKAGAREASTTAGNIDFSVVHGSPDAPAVDVFARTVAQLVDSAAYEDATDYISVPAAQYYLDVKAEGTDPIVATFDANLSGLADSAAVVFASGFLAPAGNQPAFGLFAALPNGDVVEFPATEVARLQVIHNSPSPTVDVYLGTALLLDNFAFRTATEYIWAPAGQELTVGVALDNSTSVTDTITSFKLTLVNGESYVALASGIVGNATTPFTLNIASGTREAATDANNVDFIVVHGSTDAPAVDVFARNVAQLVDSAAYGDITPYISVPAAQYYLDVKAEGTDPIVATFNADLSTLGGGAGVVFASGLLSPMMGEPAFGLFVALPNGDVEELPAEEVARLQVIHNSASPTVDVYLGTDLLIDDFVYRTATEFIWAPAGVELTIGVALDNSTSVTDTITSFKVTLDNGGSYVALASGLVGNATTPFTLNIAADAREAATNPANVDFIVVHGSTDAPAVDVFARTVAQLVDSAAYGDITPYISVPADQYYLDVKAEGTDPIVATFDADLSGLAGGAGVVFASGFLTPGANDPAFGLFVAFPDGNVAELPATAVARLQIVHNSPEPTVDIYLNSDLLVDDFEFRKATEFIWAPAETEFTVGVALDNSTSVADTIAGFPFTLANGETYIAVASGIVGNATTPFTILPVAGVRERASDPAQIDAMVHHGSPDAPAVDVILEGAGVVVNDAAYTDFTGYINPPAAPIRLQVGPANDSTNIVAAFNGDLTGLEGSSLFIFASGLFGGGTPAFGLWVATADGNTFPLTNTTPIENLPYENDRLNIYPNPTNGLSQISLELTAESPVEMTVLDLSGRIISNENLGRKPAGTHNIQLDGSNMTAGVYMVWVRTNDSQAVQKWIINK
ncbi:MAG: DUF4397 domain-containing protein [Bacteroidota bacterium]